MKQYRPAPPLLHCHATSKGYHVCESEDGGVGRHTALGPNWPTPARAVAYLETQRERRADPVSPLRVEASPAGADSGSPLPVESASAEAASA